MNKQFALAQLKRRLSELYRFNSRLSDSEATIMMYGGVMGFIEALFISGLVTASEKSNLDSLAFSAYQNARGAA